MKGPQEWSRWPQRLRTAEGQGRNYDSLDFVNEANKA